MLKDTVSSDIKDYGGSLEYIYNSIIDKCHLSHEPHNINSLTEYLKHLSSLFNQAVKDFELYNLTSYLKNTDFFIAPASSSFHLSFPHGLFIHSMLTFKNAVMLNNCYGFNINKRSLFIASAFHDLCKVNFYNKGQKWRKDDSTNRWEKYSTYLVEDNFPLGHGEKSLFILSKFVELTDEEALAIRWHMGFSDSGVHAGYPTTKPFRQSMSHDHPLSQIIMCSDTINCLSEGKDTFFDPYINFKFTVNLSSDLEILNRV